MRVSKRILLVVTSLVLASVIWLPSVHLLFRPTVGEVTNDGGVAPIAGKLMAEHLRLWTNPQTREKELAGMRAANAEWDFMGRSFFAWSLANVALSQPALAPAALEVMDSIIDETLDLERRHGVHFFLMPYGKARPFLQKPARSQFIDGEIALMLAMRCIVQNKPQYRVLLTRRVATMVARMQASPTLSAESYPDECWTFCNAIALAAIRLNDALSGADHSDLIRRWIDLAKEKLVDPNTGLLISAYRLNGQVIYAPEGSSIWVVIHCLALLDEPFARQQYGLAKALLARRRLGFGFAREWPPQAEDRMDIDSGLVIPALGASVASSGLALVAAGTFDDIEFTRSLITSLEFAGLPIERQGRLRYAASNQVGDAVVLYGLVNGPMWDRIRNDSR